MSKAEAVTDTLVALGFLPAAAERDSRTRRVLEQLYDRAAKEAATEPRDLGLDVVVQQHNNAIAQGGRSW